jgi:hypothetical protein
METYYLAELGGFQGNREWDDVIEAICAWVPVTNAGAEDIMRGATFDLEDREMYWLQSELEALGLVAMPIQP